jgi:hypothetical protein
MKLIELILDDDEAIGVEAISVVENPAIESDFIALSKYVVKLAEVSKEKRILMGALLIPNIKIPRNGDNGQEDYEVFFSKETIEKASELYLQNNNQSKSTLEHNRELEGLTLVQTWLVEDSKIDKTALHGINVPVGTWMGCMKVNNEDVWNNYVKTGKVKGFSIEGYFADKLEKPQELSETDRIINDLIDLLK